MSRALSDDQRDRLTQTRRMDRRTVRFDLPAIARVEQLAETGEVANVSTFVRQAVDEKLERDA